MISPMYKAQVDLLLQVLPYVSKEKIFALKGGTAINLFVREMPRLSVDIDLTYLLIDSRERALNNIEMGLYRIKADLEKNFPGLKVQPVASNEGAYAKLNVQGKKAQIKIEVNTITRGHLFPTKLMQVVNSVQDEFEKFAAIQIISFAELFGGKICAAVDRQHPRDIFDIKQLFENEGLTNEIWQGFIVGLVSHYKPINELLSPILKDQKSAFDNQFLGMTTVEFSYEDYIATRAKLMETIHKFLSDDDKTFLFSFENGNPEWDLFPYPVLKDLPAIKWKLHNIQKLKEANPKKHYSMLTKFKNILA